MLGRERGGPTIGRVERESMTRWKSTALGWLPRNGGLFSLEMILDNVEKPAGAPLGALPDDVGRGSIPAGQTIRILRDRQFLRQRVRLEGQPLVDPDALERSDLRGKSPVSKLIDEMKHDRCGFGNDRFTVNPSGDSSVRVDLEIVLGLLCIASSINEDDVIFDSYFFEQDEPRSVGIRREILKLIHRNLPFAFSYGGK